MTTKDKSRVLEINGNAPAVKKLIEKIKEQKEEQKEAARNKKPDVIIYV